MEELRARAEKGDLEAMTEYGKRLMTGIGCVPNAENAIKTLNQAVELGSGVAARQAGIYYAYGAGVEKNESMATKYYRAGAQLGDADSMYRLFQNLSIGAGCAVDLAEADVWLSRAKDLGHGKAKDAWNHLTNSKLFSSNLKQLPPPEHSDSEDLSLAMQSYGIRPVNVNRSLNPTEMKIEPVEEVKIVTDEYKAGMNYQEGYILILIYAVFGGVMGFFLRNIYISGNMVFNSGSLYDHLSTIGSITIYLTILGAIFGFLLGILCSMGYEFTNYGMIFYIPMLLLPVLTLVMAPVLMPLIKAVGAFLMGVLSLAVGLAGLWCICSSSNG